MELIKKDITTVKDGIIIHQVNNEGVMGGGVALAIRHKYPQHYNDYISVIKKDADKLSLLGQCVVTQATDDVIVIGTFSQNGLGYRKVFTDYDAMKECFKTVSKIAKETGKQVYIPYLIGCVRGGGDWSVVSTLIQTYLPDAILCEYNKG